MKVKFDGGLKGEINMYDVCKNCGLVDCSENNCTYGLLEKQNKTLKNMLDEWNDLNNKGLLLKLPYKIGDTVYFVDEKHCNECEYNVDQGDLCNDYDNEECPKVIRSIEFTYSMIPYFGTSYFATKEEAEKQLNEQINL